MGALVELKPQTPPVAPMRDSSTTNSQLVINITPLTGTATGGASIDSYELQMDSGSGFVSLFGFAPYTTLTQFTVTSGILTGQAY